MSVRTDVTVDWNVNPRIIEVASPSTTISCQDLVDTLRSQEWWLVNLRYPKLLAELTSGKVGLGTGGKLTGITCVLEDALLQFEARGGPSYEQCQVTDGNFAAIDDMGVNVNPVSPTAFTQVVIELDTSAALIPNSGDGLTLPQFMGTQNP